MVVEILADLYVILSIHLIIYLGLHGPFFKLESLGESGNINRPVPGHNNNKEIQVQSFTDKDIASVKKNLFSPNIYTTQNV